MNFVRSLHGAAVASRQPLIKFPQRYSAKEEEKRKDSKLKWYSQPISSTIAVAKMSPVVESPGKPAQEKIAKPKPHTGKAVVLSSSYGRRLPSQEEILVINVSTGRKILTDLIKCLHLWQTGGNR